MTDTPQPTVLLAEDDGALRDLLQLALTQAGWQVTCAQDGVEALELARRTPPHLVLLDILLPKLNGLDVLRELKKQSGFELRPIIVMSELAFRETVEQAIGAGAQDFVVKPFDLQVLLDKVQKAFARPMYRTVRQPVPTGRMPHVRPFRPAVFKKTVENFSTLG